MMDSENNEVDDMQTNDTGGGDVQPGLLDLNDDCILEICKYLTISEAFQLIGTIDSRIDAIAYRRIASLKVLTVSLRNFPTYNAEQLEVIGGNLRSLHLSAGYSLSDKKVLDLLQPLCAGAIAGRLQQFTLNYTNFNENYLRCLEQVAQRLQIVDFNFCQLTDALLEPLLRQCGQLRELSVLGNYALCGESLWAVNKGILKSLQVEIHELWTLDVNEFSAQHPKLVIIAYAKGRAKQTIYRNI